MMFGSRFLGRREVPLEGLVLLGQLINLALQATLGSTQTSILLFLCVCKKEEPT